MKCIVACSCGKLEGEAQLVMTVIKKKPTPSLAYKLNEFFVIKKDGPSCVVCGEPALTKGDWSS